ncbi:beta-N-acetylhexosaminidase [Streptosporangiaceae bacterium NEAU-GS5]|nr:beta-N-acetylhexosaminidase [Streptosporangiaceae bacterium NEAU-GS5]
MDDFLPRPQSADVTPGSFALPAGAAVSGPFADAVRLPLAALDLIPGEDGPVRVVHEPRLGPEAYALEIGADGVRITAGDRAGAFYAAQTLRQLAGPAAFRSSSDGAELAYARIEDAPAYAWRGAHLDVARHFQPKREVLRFIDLIAAHKLNRLHLHLVDDQGWRVESPAYPLLHEVGSHRPQTDVSYYGEEPALDGTPHGGYYTRADLAEIGAYARARAVTVVPEIDVPGHATAILAAYPSLGSRAGESHAVMQEWGISRAILSPLPPTVEFLETVFDEVIGALGSTPYFHVGGDECVLDDWKASPEIAAYQASLGLAGVGELHAWFLRTLADSLAERGSRAVVWDEAFVSGKLRDDTVVMPWRGAGVGRRAAAAGHDVVMTPVFPLYFDYAEAASVEEPLAIGEAVTVADVAAFDPAVAPQVIGLQFQLWSERIPDGRTLDYRAWPRGCAAAEVAWAGNASADFPRRLSTHLERLTAFGVEYRPPAGPHPWQRGGAGPRRHRPGVVPVHDVVRHLDEMTHTPDSTRPS